MKRYQADIGHFQEKDTQIFGISVDTRFAQKVFADQVGVQFQLLSDFPKNNVSKLYGIFDEERGVARRTTFVVDKKGIVRRIDAGRDALEIGGVKSACAELP